MVLPISANFDSTPQLVSGQFLNELVATINALISQSGGGNGFTAAGGGDQGTWTAEPPDNSADIQINGGEEGNAYVIGGNGAGNGGGSANVIGGDEGAGAGGLASVRGGSGTTDGGDVFIDGGSGGSGHDGYVRLGTTNALPTADPLVAGAIFTDGAPSSGSPVALKISGG